MLVASARQKRGGKHNERRTSVSNYVTRPQSPTAAFLKGEIMTDLQKNTVETLRAKMNELEDRVMLIIPFEAEKEEPYVRIRKRLNSYGERIADLVR